MPVSNATVLAFKNITITINHIIIVVFFDLINKKILDYLLTARFIENKPFNLILIYFKTIKINNQSIFNLYCLIWLRSICNFSNSCRKIYDNNAFFICYF